MVEFRPTWDAHSDLLRNRNKKEKGREGEREDKKEGEKDKRKEELRNLIPSPATIKP